MKVNSFILKICSLSGLILFAVGGINTAYGQSGVLYPYVDNTTDLVNGPIIVVQDANGGVPDDVVGVPTSDADNKIAAKFQVAKTTLSVEPDKTEPAGILYKWDYDELNRKCASEFGADWRLATQRELILVWLMGGAKAEYYGQVYTGSGTVGTANHIAGDNPLYKYSGFVPLEYQHWSSTSAHSVMANTVWEVMFTTGQTYPDSKGLLRNVRCVRTVN